MKGFGTIIHGQTVGFLEKNIPEPGPFEALMEPVVIAPCTSDVHIAFEQGHNPARNNRILGHESVGRIVKLGEGCTEYKVGDVVVVPCTTPNWRTLEVQDGAFQHSGGLCQGMRIGTSQDGVMAEYYLVNDVEMNTARIPEGVSLESALMVSDMMTTGFHGVELADVQFGDSVVVIGTGPVGLMSIAAAKLRGAGRIIAVGSRPKCVELAYYYGANEVVNYKEGDIVEQIMALTGGRKVDRTVIAGGGTEQLPIAYRLTRPAGGIGDLVAADTPPRLDTDTAAFCRFVAHHKFSGGLCPGGRRRAERLLDLIKYGRVDPSLMLTHKFNGLESCPDAFELMHKKPQELVKPIVYMNV
ncbi:MAG: alcohol dehydrogenase catalytic domain-containing protein [Oscillospiraceae bacterium]|nr:alcohol dehydrogenase catalytic domain-containing protein [Oscillospiraceae bacterium]